MIAAFIQARFTSTRLPGKVLKTILGKPMLELMIERVKFSKKIDLIVIVTSDSQDDQPIVELCRNLGVDHFRGDLENVLKRFYQAAIKFKPDHIVRLTGDCPLIDPNVIDDVIDLYNDGNYDYGTNCIPVTYPDGLDVEIFSVKSLKKAYNEAVLPSHLEHISIFFEEHPEKFKTVNLANNKDLSNLRWTVDEPEDFMFVKWIYEALYPIRNNFSMNDILDLLEKRPNLKEINKKFMRNEGLIKSKEKDKQVLESEKSDMGI